MSYAVSSPVIEGAVPVQDEHMEVCEDGSPEYAPGGIALGTAPAEFAQPKEAGLELQHPKAEARRTDDDGIEADAADIDPVPESPEYVLKQGSLDGSSSAHLDPVHTSARNADFHDPCTCCLQGGITRPASLMEFNFAEIAMLLDISGLDGTTSPLISPSCAYLPSCMFRL